VITTFSTEKDEANAEGELRREFERLVAEWKSGRRPTSAAVKMAAHPAYQRIIEMGKANSSAIVPLLLAELERSPDHWFIALHAITGADPVPATSRGRLKEMTTAWKRWWESEQG